MKSIVTATHTGGMRFEASTHTGHVVVMDASPDAGGANTGVRPYDLLLVGLAGCTGMDVISILRKKRQAVTAFWIEIDAQRAPDHPKVYTKISLRYHIRGTGINPAAVARAIELSESTYCSAVATLRASAKVTTAYTVYPEDEPSTP
jgi:putative redox protein